MPADLVERGAITSRALEILIKAVSAPATIPHPAYPISQWFRPLTARALKDEHIHTLADLTNIMTSRGASWWRGLRRIGARRPQMMHAWVTRHEPTLGNIYPIDLVTPPGQPKVAVELEKEGSLAPIDRATALPWLDGSEGANRDTRFNYIGASNDLEAINSYLHRFRDRPHTLRAYTKKVERFLFWCLIELGKPRSSVPVPDSLNG